MTKLHTVRTHTRKSPKRKHEDAFIQTTWRLRLERFQGFKKRRVRVPAGRQVV